MKIRSILSKDVEKVTSLWEECGLVVPWNDPIKDFQRKLENSPEEFLVGEREGEVIASVG